MFTLPPPREGGQDLPTAHPVDGEGTVSEAIVDAFLGADVDVFCKDTTLEDWVDTDALDGFEWSSGGPLTVSTRIWDHEVVITADEVRIYPGSASD